MSYSLSVLSSPLQSVLNSSTLTDDCSIRNIEGYELTLSKIQGVAHLILKDKFGIKMTGPFIFGLRKLQPNGKNSEETSFESILEQNIKQVAQSKDKFGFQVYKKQNRVAVIFGRYGLTAGLGEK